MMLRLILFNVLFLSCSSGSCQDRVNFILEINDELIQESEVGEFQLIIQSNNSRDRINAEYTLGELQIEPSNFEKLQKIEESSNIEVSFIYFKPCKGVSKKVLYSFELKKQFFTQRYLHIRIFELKKSEDKKYGVEYDSPLGTRLLPKNNKRKR